MRNLLEQAGVGVGNLASCVSSDCRVEFDADSLWAYLPCNVPTKMDVDENGMPELSGKAATFLMISTLFLAFLLSIIYFHAKLKK